MPRARLSESKHCSRCQRRCDTTGRYCRRCRAKYMRAWRKDKVLVPRETWEKLTEGQSA